MPGQGYTLPPGGYPCPGMEIHARASIVLDWTNSLTHLLNEQLSQTHPDTPSMFAEAKETTLDVFNTFYLQFQYEKSVEMFKRRGDIVNA